MDNKQHNAVQTLSRLNRCHPKKQDTFVLDFANDPEMIRLSFQRYYNTTILEGESDVNKFNDLSETIEAFNFYTQDNVDQVATLKLMGTDEDRPEEKTEFVQTYFANPDFQNFVNARVFQAAVCQLSSQL